MYQPQNRIAVLDRIGQHPNANQVIHIFKIDVLCHHFLIDAVDVLGSTGNVANQAGLPEFLVYDVAHILNVMGSLILLLRHFFHKHRILIGVKVFERAIFQFSSHPAYSQTIGQRSENIHGFAGDSALPLFGKGTQGLEVVGAVGEFDQNDPNISGHRKDHLAVVFRLAFLAAGKFHLADFRYAIHQLINFIAEQVLNFFGSGEGILDGIVQKPGGNRLLIHFQTRQVVGDFDGMGNIGFARFSALASMGFRRVEVCVQNDIHIRFGMIF